jgi:hypothetical protein
VSDLGAQLVADIRAKLADTQGQIRYAGKNSELSGTIAEVVVTGLELIKTTSEHGPYNAIDGVVRYQASDEPEKWAEKPAQEPAIMYDIIEILLPGYTDWDEEEGIAEARVRNRLVMAGAVRLTLVGVSQEI